MYYKPTVLNLMPPKNLPLPKKGLNSNKGTKSLTGP